MLRFPKTLRALNSRNYRLFFTAQAVSMTGLWMHRVAMGWLVYRLTGSNNALGIIDFAASFPIFLFTAFAGALVERWDLRKTLIVCQISCMCVALSLSLTTFTGIVSFPFVVCCSLVLGTIDSFELPCRYSLVSYLVDKREDVPNAVALNSMNFNLARMIGPTIGGFMIHLVGEGFCFLINGFAYLATVITVKKMKMERPPIGKTGKGGTPIRDTVEGLKLVRAFEPYKLLLAIIAVTGVFCFPSIVLMPAMAKSVLHGTSETYGMLLFGVAVGALAGSLLMASLKSAAYHEWWCTKTCVGFGVATILFSFSTNIWMGVALAAPIGFCMVSCTITCNTLLQSMAPDNGKSRIMSLYTFAMVGVPPFGSLFAGSLGDMLGTRWALLICGIICTSADIFLMRKIDALRPQMLMALKKQKSI